MAEENKISDDRYETLADFRRDEESEMLINRVDELDSKKGYRLSRISPINGFLTEEKYSIDTSIYKNARAAFEKKDESREHYYKFSLRHPTETSACVDITFYLNTTGKIKSGNCLRDDKKLILGFMQTMKISPGKLEPIEISKEEFEKAKEIKPFRRKFPC